MLMQILVLGWVLCSNFNAAHVAVMEARALQLRRPWDSLLPDRQEGGGLFLCLSYGCLPTCIKLSCLLSAARCRPEMSFSESIKSNVAYLLFAPNHEHNPAESP